MQKDFDGWNAKKKIINDDQFLDYVHSREVWWCSIGVNIGYEQDGKHEYFERPVLIFKKFSKDTVIIIPLTSQIKDNKYYVTFLHNEQQFAAIISQLRLISTKRLRRKMYNMDPNIFKLIRCSVKKML